MSYKRRRTNYSLTGGTGDVNPQFMNMFIQQSAADTLTQLAQPIPVQRLQNAGRAQVMEVLKVFINSTPISTSATAAISHSIRVTLGTKSGVASVNDPTIFAYQEKSNINAFTAAGTGLLNKDVGPFIVDLTDGAGHGFLVGSDQIYVNIQSTATGQTNAVSVKILYRWKDVSIQEYVGIVQSQQ